MATAGDVMTLVQQMRANDIAEIGDDSTAQQAYLVTVINAALKELAHIAYRTRISDALAISADGDVTFKYSSSAITDLYSPLRILDGNSKALAKRTSYEAPTGWWRESDSTAFNIKGVTSGSYRLHYVRYPSPVTGSGSTLDFPEAGIMTLAFWCSGIVLESRNAYDEANAMYARAEKRFGIPVLANEAARGYSSGGYVPSYDFAKKIRGEF
jgi:hypothetical protein